MDGPELRPEQVASVVRELQHQQAEYALIGGAGGKLHGATRATRDLDLLVRGSLDNLQRVAQALSALDARSGRATARDADDLRTINTRWDTRIGTRVDVLLEATGPDDDHPISYRDVEERVEDVVITTDVGEITVTVASLDDIIKLKEWADRPKDRDALPELRELAQRRAAAERPEPLEAAYGPSLKAKIEPVKELPDAPAQD